MVSASELRPGACFKHEGIVWETVQYQHVQRPRLAPLVRIKMKNYKLGTTVERTFSPDDKFEEVYLDEKKLQYSYKDGDTFHFMDIETYDQYEFSKEQMGDSAQFLMEEMQMTMLMYQGEVMGVRLPTKVELKVTSAPPGVKGNSAGSITIPVTVETGAVVNVPPFIKEGDMIRIDTRTGEYVERVSK